MTPTEAMQLLARAAAFDNRQPSRAAAEAWAAALHDMPADPDALAAIARYYGTPPTRPGERLWIQPHDVRTGRQAIRDERLEGFQYEPQPGDDNTRQYLTNLRAQREAVASGHRPPAAERPAIDAGPNLNELLSSIGHTIPATDAPPADRGPLGVPCPKCSARIGHHCRWPGGARRPTHGARTRTAKGQPATSPDTAQDAADRRAAAAAYLARLTPEQRAELDRFQKDAP